MLLGLCLHGVAWAASSVTLSGILGDKALLSVSGGAPKVVRVGEAYRSVKLVEVANNQVVVEEDGRRRTIALGFSSAGGSPARPQEKNAVLYSDGRGHFMAAGRVNGTEVSFVVDTGASVVTLPKSMARRAGVALEAAPSTLVATAGGVVKAWPVKLNQVTVGGISLHLVDGVVLEDSHLPVALLGMSFLNRTDMTREGQVMTLRQRY
jgi:aspartyl protease family protein